MSPGISVPLSLKISFISLASITALTGMFFIFGPSRLLKKDVEPLLGKHLDFIARSLALRLGELPELHAASPELEGILKLFMRQNELSASPEVVLTGDQKLRISLRKDNTLSIAPGELIGNETLSLSTGLPV